MHRPGLLWSLNPPSLSINTPPHSRLHSHSWSTGIKRSIISTVGGLLREWLLLILTVHPLLACWLTSMSVCRPAPLQHCPLLDSQQTTTPPRRLEIPLTSKKMFFLMLYSIFRFQIYKVKVLIENKKYFLITGASKIAVRTLWNIFFAFC